MTLSLASVAVLGSRNLKIPAYDRKAVSIGVVHFGPGAFHRVHQACYLDDVLHTDPRWGICEVSLHSTGVRDALVPQDGLYTIAILDAESSFRVIGSVKEVLVAPESPSAVLDRMVAPTTYIVSATITEKGYCLNKEGGLDFSHPDIAYDLKHPETPKTFVGFLARALRLRHDKGHEPFNVISCDNLADNGHRLRRAVLEFVRSSDPTLAAWIEKEVTFPCTMVDSITPATDDALRTRVKDALGVEDLWPVQREFFCQWVIENKLRGPQPDWASVGVTVTDDVAGFERAKLRLLNGAHSTLAYTGSLAGYETVSAAMGDTALATFVRRMMLENIRSGLAAPQGLDLDQYIEAVLRRFRNPTIRHLLAQIAWDGSQKLPFRILPTITENLAAGRSIARLCVPLAAWFHFIRRMTRDERQIMDPLAAQLSELAKRCTGDAAADVSVFLSLEKVFNSDLARNGTFRAALENAYARLAAVESPAQLGEALSGIDA
ncbi:mannitol dehydrogenase family protein [Steroidobacter agaridevorans]|uniref:mannitol dehydrogenase family protein n=1 Tax=Steroidobacter agaridevorans TaxID=2695856 RepID=UPI00132AEDF9|nr:mannitol dehydrogenase family protein [Steroidobacter agaridevorans]GFE89326.1 mannitol 2-dehydrogenase [Steroidobacter agaridevorans]